MADNNENNKDRNKDNVEISSNVLGKACLPDIILQAEVVTMKQADSSSGSVTPDSSLSSICSPTTTLSDISTFKLDISTPPSDTPITTPTIETHPPPVKRSDTTDSGYFTATTAMDKKDKTAKHEEREVEEEERNEEEKREEEQKKRRPRFPTVRSSRNMMNRNAMANPGASLHKVRK